MATVPERFTGLIGQSVRAIDTPALVVDLDAMEQNLQRMARFVRERGLRLRPHAKMHKSAELARLQIAHGAVGVCVQKVGEALALARAGIGDILITNEVIAPAKLRRLAEAARELPTHFGLAVDSAEGLDAVIAAVERAGLPGQGTLDVLVEIDVGQGRCGVAPGAAAVPLAQRIATAPGLRWAGLQAYHGGAQHRRSPDERREAIAAAAAAVHQTRDALTAAGLPPPAVTGAGTGSFLHEAVSGLWTELQAGSYLFMDADYARNAPDDPGALGLTHGFDLTFDHALYLQAQVISRSPDRAVIDAGHKSHALDSGPPVVAHPAGLRWSNGGDEHGVLHGDADPGSLPALGEPVWLIPGHCDPTVNLHDWLIGVRGGVPDGHVERLIHVNARGAVD